jgi:hypothetical protein
MGIAPLALAVPALAEDPVRFNYFDCVYQVLSCFFNGGKRLCCFQ